MGVQQTHLKLYLLLSPSPLLKYHRNKRYLQLNDKIYHEVGDLVFTNHTILLIEI